MVGSTVILASDVSTASSTSVADATGILHVALTGAGMTTVKIKSSIGKTFFSRTQRFKK